MELVAITALALLLFVLIAMPRKRRGAEFDWTHRRAWWRPRWAFPDDR